VSLSPDWLNENDNELNRIMVTVTKVDMDGHAIDLGTFTVETGDNLPQWEHEPEVILDTDCEDNGYSSD
jgi:hypothetical protein